MVAYHGAGETLPSVSLSLPTSSPSPPIPLPRSHSSILPRAQPRWRGGPAPESAGVRPHARGTKPENKTSHLGAALHGEFVTGPGQRNFAPGDKVIALLPTSSSKLLAKWQGPFEVTRRVGDLNYEVIQTDRSGTRQIYHPNLLKKWSEVEPVMLAISGEDDLGPEVNTKILSLTLAPGGDHLSPSQLTDVARLQTEFTDVFLPLPGRTNLIQHHIGTEPGVVVRS